LHFWGKYPCNSKVKKKMRLCKRLPGTTYTAKNIFFPSYCLSTAGKGFMNSWKQFDISTGGE
jgi:hypothetical protein